MELFNPTFERFEIQHDSRIYDFKPKSSVEVPEWPKTVGESLLRLTDRLGVFEVKASHDSEEFKKAERDGLKRYLEGRLSTRISNYNSYKDSMDKAGKTVEADYNFLKANRWKKEISEAINYEEEKLGEETFLPKKAKSEKVKAV